MVQIPRVLLISACAMTLLRGQELRVVDRSQPLAGAFDSSRGRLVSIGTRGETNEWDGARWFQRPAELLPMFQTQQRMVHDDLRGRMILAGGDRTTPFTTRAFDGATWRTLPTANAPLPRQLFALVADSARDEIVLFGGLAYSGGALMGDTWIFDGQSWSQATPTTSPSARWSSTACFDRNRSRVVLFGGELITGAATGDTWEWDGTNWTAVSVASAPPSRRGAAMAFDPLRGRTVMFGGFDSAYMTDVWEFDGTNWYAATPATSGPGGGVGGIMAFDEGLGECVAFGSYNYGVVAFDTWSWDGTRWASHTATAPARNLRPNDIAVGSPTGDGIFLYRASLGETWSWTRSGWLEHQASPPTPARFFSSGCSTPGAAFLYGGVGIAAPNPDLSDLWQWNGQAWAQLATQGPLLAEAVSLAFDDSRQELLLFGVASATSTVPETWVWTGSAWQQRTPAVSPSLRFRAGMAYDAGRGRVVLHGGLVPGTFASLTDTWEWDGVRWIAMNAPNSPGPGSLAFDVSRGAIVSSGLAGHSVPSLWSYNGMSWTQIPVSNPSQELLTDWVGVGWPYLGGTLIYGATATYDLSADQAEVQHYGSSCTAAAPVIAANEWPRADTPTFGIEVANAPTNSFVALLAATGSATLPIGACTQLVLPGQVALLLPTSAGGVARVGVPLPASVGFMGLDLFFQAAALEPGAPNGFTMTRGLSATIGR